MKYENVNYLNFSYGMYAEMMYGYVGLNSIQYIQINFTRSFLIFFPLHIHHCSFWILDPQNLSIL